MTLMQVQLHDPLHEAIQKRSKHYGVPASTLVRMALVDAFMEENVEAGNVFNAARDNHGKGLPVDDLISML